MSLIESLLGINNIGYALEPDDLAGYKNYYDSSTAFAQQQAQEQAQKDFHDWIKNVDRSPKTEEPSGPKYMGEVERVVDEIKLLEIRQDG